MLSTLLEKIVFHLSQHRLQLKLIKYCVFNKDSNSGPYFYTANISIESGLDNQNIQPDIPGFSLGLSGFGKRKWGNDKRLKFFLKQPILWFLLKTSFCISMYIVPCLMGPHLRWHNSSVDEKFSLSTYHIMLMTSQVKLNFFFWIYSWKGDTYFQGSCIVEETKIVECVTILTFLPICVLRMLKKYTFPYFLPPPYSFHKSV